MPRAIFSCLTIVAAFYVLAAPAAAQVSENVPVPQLIEDLARGYGLEPARTPALFVPDLARVVYARAPGEVEQRPRVPSVERTAAASSRVVVPVPLTLDFWSRTIFEEPIRREDLLIEIIGDKQGAALFAHGLAGLDDRTLSYLAGERTLARRLYQRAPAAFGAFGESIRVDQGRVQVPGGAAAVALWEALLKQRVTGPDQFITVLFEKDHGRLAYLYDLIARLDEPRRAFVLGLWIDDDAARQARFLALANAVVNGYPEWRVEDAPLSRPVADLSMLVARLRVAPNGAPEVPDARAFWAAVLATVDVTSPAPGQTELATGPPVDAAWFIEMTGTLSTLVRGDRLDQIAFVHRVFKDAPRTSLTDMVVAARGFRRHRALLMAFERIGTRTPATYATVVRQSARLIDRDPDNAFWMHAQMQGTLTLIVRMASTGGLDARTAETLAISLCELFDTGPRATAGMAAWLNDRLLPRLPDGDDVESRVSLALAGRRQTSPRRVQWEGDSYRVDLVAGELTRLGEIRTKQASFTLDLALALEDARRLADRGRPGDLEAASAALIAITERFASVISRPTPTVAARGVVPIADLGPRIRLASLDLSAAASGRNVTRLEVVRAQLAGTATAVLGEALISFAYAVHLGDPKGTALLGRNIAVRHDFGFTHLDRDMRERLPWSLPVQHVDPGSAWHVTGSLVGLDLALAPLALRRINLEPLDTPPRLSTGERDAFALSVALMDPARLRDEDRTAIAAAIARGRARVTSVATADELAQVMDALRIDPRRRRALVWTAANDRASAPTFFSLAELLWLGGVPAGVDVDAWGASALATTGCTCTALLSVDEWRRIETRPLAGLLASATSDLNLRIAVELDAFDLPATLAHEVLSAAMLEFTDSVAPIDAQDWLALSRAAQAIPRRRFEDYVAATTRVGGALVPDTAGSAPE